MRVCKGFTVCENPTNLNQNISGGIDGFWGFFQSYLVGFPCRGPTNIRKGNMSWEKSTPLQRRIKILKTALWRGDILLQMN